MSNKKSQIKAYDNTHFLHSVKARPLRILAEFLEPEKRFANKKIKDTIVFFGSSRIKSPEDARSQLSQARQKYSNLSGSKKTNVAIERAEMDVEVSSYYRDAVRLSGMLTKWSMSLNGRQFIICTGGGPGIMEAVNRGAKEAGGKSIGLNISLPFEQEPNPFISEDLSFEFHYFFVRKFWFFYMAKAVVVFPGGFGTMDEMMEMLTLVQTGKIKKHLEVVLYGKEFWEKVINFDILVKWNTISSSDLDLFKFVDTPEEAFMHLKKQLTAHYLKS